MRAIPPGLAGMINEGDPVQPRPSSSVLLLRGRSPWRVLLVRRPRDVDFAPGAHVFPGGSVHPEDLAFEDPLRAAALREVFEEVGVLIGRTSRGPAGPTHSARLRERLAAGTGWRAALADEGVELSPGRLVPLTRWITPERIVRRFDTHFFLARMPSRQEVVPGPAEIVDWLWARPVEALGDPRLSLVHATRRILESVAGEDDSSRLIGKARRRRRVPIVRPRVVEASGGWLIVEE
ncbi:MAG: NUDIX hydrolase [Candidatus Dormibacterales bacterium]